MILAMFAILSLTAPEPQSADAYYKSGDQKFDKGDLDGAVAHLTKSIDLDPKSAGAYAKRGYDQRSWAEALADFRKTCDLAPGLQDYPRIRIWLARARLGERDAATKQLAEYLKSRKADDWPKRVMRFLAGELPAEEFLAEAESKDAKTDRQQKCEAYFYVGARGRIDGDKDKAREYFRKCLETDVKNFLEYTSATAELAAIEKAR